MLFRCGEVYSNERDKEGNELYKGIGEKDFQTVVISVPEMIVGNEYEIEAGESVISFVPEETITYVNKEGIQEAAAMRPGRGGGKRPEPPEGWKNGERPEPPESWKGGKRSEPPEDWKDGERPEPPEGRKGGKRPEPSEEQPE